MSDCPESFDGQHVMARRRDGKACAFCGARVFGSSTLSLEEVARIRATEDETLRRAHAQKEPRK